MTNPMPPVPGAPPAPPLQPPVPPPTPFPSRANDSEPAVAQATAKRLSKLMFDPRFSEQPPVWQAVVNDVYQRAIQALQPAPQLPKGVIIKADAATGPALAEEEQAALQGMQAKPPAQPAPMPAQAPQHPMQKMPGMAT